VPPLTLTHRIIASIVGGLLLILVLRLIRRRRLDTALSVWWIAAGIGIIVLAWCDGPLMSLATKAGFSEIRSLLLVAGLLFVLFTCLHMSATITRLSSQVRKIGQAVALKCYGPPKKHTDTSCIESGASESTVESETSNNVP